MNKTIPNASKKHFDYLPSDWELRKLEQLVHQKITYGIVQPGKFDKNGVLLIRGVDYMSGWKKVESFFKVSSDLHNKFKRSTTRRGDVLLSIAGYAGYVSVVPDWVEEANITQTTARISVAEQLAMPHFVAQFLGSDEGKLQSRRYIKGSAQEGLNLNDVQRFLIPVPPLPEQKKIASILTSVDEVIENTQKQIEKLQDLKKATMNELLTKGIGHTEFKDSELGRIPKSWEVGRFDEFITLQRGHDLPTQNRKKGVIPIFGSNGIVGLHNNSLVKETGVITGRSGSIGDVHFVKGLYWALNTTLYVKDFHGNDAEFISHYLRFFGLERFATGTGVPTLNRNDVHNQVITFPPFEEQLKICEAIAVIESRLELLLMKLSQTQSLKKSLMQDLLTGKVRVSVS
jgi:type I restriction enzyme S subunit